MVFQYILRMIRTGWKIIMACALIAVILSLLISLNTVPLYRTQATFVISPNADLPSSRDVVSSMAALDTLKIFSTYGNILTSQRVLDEAVKAMNLSGVDLSQYRRRTVLLPNSIILMLTIEGPDPAVAALMANTIGQKGIDFIKGYFTVFDINFLDKAVAPAQPFVPDPARAGAIALGIALLAGLLITVFRDIIRTPLREFWRRTLVDRQSGAYSRRYFMREVEREFLENKTQPTALAIIEMEGLRDVVGVLPEFMLSDILHQVTFTLHNQLRGNDIIGRWDKLSFSVLLPGTPRLPAERTVKRLVRALSAKMSFGPARSDEIVLYPSYGLGTRSARETMRATIERAEDALEKMKSSSYEPTPQSR